MIYGKLVMALAVVLLTVTLISGEARAASCCGGGSASSLTLPKFSKMMLDISLDMESYGGYWDGNGDYRSNPEGSDLSQYRINLGFAKRFASRWQGSVTVPLVRNENKYASISSSKSGVGDMALNVWYESFDGIMCVWKVRNYKDLIPAAYFGATLTVPTGISPYDSVDNSFDITGRGFYRLDLNMLLEKTVYPWTVSFQLSMGKHFEREVNREYGTYVEPYKKRLGDRRLWSLSGGYTYFLDSMDTITGTVAYSDLWEGRGTIGGAPDPATGMSKRSISATTAWASMDRNWVLRFSLSHTLPWSGWGENFPITDVITIGVSHVFR